jgi:hypothetical protein
MPNADLDVGFNLYPFVAGFRFELGYVHSLRRNIARPLRRSFGPFSWICISCLMMNAITIPVLTNTNNGPSYFVEHSYNLDDLNGSSGLLISPRIGAANFRHRRSEPGYCSSWHVAGDPTLVIIRTGTLRIGLRDGSYRDFTSGDQFIAQDRLTNNGLPFEDNTIHGHTAQVIGRTPLLAVHIKLVECV